MLRSSTCDILEGGACPHPLRTIFVFRGFGCLLQDVAVDVNANVYVADTGNHRIRLITHEVRSGVIRRLIILKLFNFISPEFDFTHLQRISAPIFRHNRRTC